VLVASRPLLRGDGVGAADVHGEERDITRLGYGYIENLDQVAGRSLARAVARGSVLSPGALGGRRMVRAGDHVQMVARLDGIEVRADGVALGSGDNGARLRVRNESSGKVVDAMVSSPGVVVALP
jgi:flagellar basal body P-ring formation protein FlgA